MKKYNKNILCAIIFFLLIPIIVASATKSDKEEGILMEVFNEVEADFLEEEINIDGKILNEFIEKQEMIEIKDDIIESLNIDIELDEEYLAEDNFTQLTIQGLHNSKNPVTIILSSYKSVESSEKETYLFINLQKREQFIEFNDTIDKIRYYYDRVNMPMDITRCITGTYEGKIYLEEVEKLILNAMENIHGEIVEEYKEDDILSLSIFTPKIEKYIYTGENKMNLNIASRYNEYEDKTYIIIGTPIITTGY